MPVPVKSTYTSCIKINGVPILPPLITKRKQIEIQQYRDEAVRIEEVVSKQKKLREYIDQLYQSNQSVSLNDDHDAVIKQNECTNYHNYSSEKELDATIASLTQLTCDIEASQYINDQFVNITGVEKYINKKTNQFKSTSENNRIAERNDSLMENIKYHLNSRNTNINKPIDLRSTGEYHRIAEGNYDTMENNFGNRNINKSIDLNYSHNNKHIQIHSNLILPAQNTNIHSTLQNYNKTIPINSKTESPFKNRNLENSSTENTNPTKQLNSNLILPVQNTNFISAENSRSSKNNSITTERNYGGKKKTPSYSNSLTAILNANLDLTLTENCNYTSTMPVKPNSLEIEYADAAESAETVDNVRTVENNYSSPQKNQVKSNSVSPCRLIRSNSYTLDGSSKNRLIRSNSYILDTPSPALMEHLRRNNEELANNSILIENRSCIPDSHCPDIITPITEDIANTTISRDSCILDTHSTALIEQFKKDKQNKSKLNDSYVLDTHSPALVEISTSNEVKSNRSNNYILEDNKCTNKCTLHDNYILEAHRPVLNNTTTNPVLDTHSPVLVEVPTIKNEDNYKSNRSNNYILEDHMHTNKSTLHDNYILEAHRSGVINTTTNLNKTKKSSSQDNYELEAHMPVVIELPTNTNKDISNKSTLRNNYMLNTNNQQHRKNNDGALNAHSPAFINQQQHRKNNDDSLNTHSPVLIIHQQDIKNDGTLNITNLKESIENAALKYNEIELIDLENTSKINESVYSNLSRMDDYIDLDTSHTETELKNLSDIESNDNKSDSEFKLKEFINNNVPNSKTEQSEDNTVKETHSSNNLNDTLREILQNIPEEYTKQILELIERQQQLDAVNSKGDLNQSAKTEDERSQSRISLAEPENFSTPIENVGGADSTIFYSINVEESHDKITMDGFMRDQVNLNETFGGLAADVAEKMNCSRELFPSYELQQRSKQDSAASIIGAAVKGYLVRRLLHTSKVQNLIQIIKDALICAVELHSDTIENIDESDVELHRRLIQQVSAACYAFHNVFFGIPTHEQMAIISTDRQMKIEKARRPQSSSSLTSSFRSRKGSKSSKTSM